jgi:MATE family multidrug resistance protein
MVLVDVMAWTWFVLLLGRIGTVALAASNVAFNINMFAFGPMIGLSTAVQILVGQRLGERRADLAARSTWSAFWPAFAYTCVLSAGFLFAPNLFLAPLRWNASPEEYAEWYDVIVVLLRYVVLYAIFDMAALVFAGALRGAGDTRFVMLATLIVSISVMVVPSYLAIEVWHADVFVAWWFVAGYVMALGGAFFVRFQRGRWRSMSVIADERSEASERVAVGLAS